MEGIGFGTRAILDAFADAGYQSGEMTVGGGASASDLWLQIHADTAGFLSAYRPPPMRLPPARLCWQPMALGTLRA